MLKLLGIQRSELQEAIEQVKEAIRYNKKKDKQLCIHERLLTVQLLLQEKSMADIVEVIGRNQSTSYNYAGMYRDGGIDGLVSFFYQGSESKLTPDLENQLIDTIENKIPKDCGFEVECNWTGPLIREWVAKNLGIEYSERGIRSLLERIGFSFTRPTYHLAKSDESQKEVFLAEFEGLKKTPGRGHRPYLLL